ncbi:MAG: HAMP domain-containing protein, partial [Planctomycetes bacterium]|nr:HAMP domain-containing protein [Planctomycetota bacterium]
MLRSVQTKILFWAGFCLCATAGTVVYYFAQSTRAEIVASAQREVEAEARARGDALDAEFERAMTVVRELTQTLAAVKDPSVNLDISRDNVTGILSMLLQKHPELVGVFTAWEPKAFDGMDAGYANVAGHDATGRLVPYAERDESGAPRCVPLADYESVEKDAHGHRKGAADLSAKESKREQCLPMEKRATPRGERWCARLVVPILVGEQFLGIAGADLDLGFVQARADEIEKRGRSESLVVTDTSGTTVARTSGAAAIGTTSSSTQDAEHIRAKASFGPGQAESAFTCEFTVPQAIVLANGEALLDRSVRLGAALILGGLVLLWLVARGIARPLRRASEMLQALAKGDFDRKFESRSRDEIGVMSRSLGQTAEVLRALRDEIATLTNAARDGRLSERADPQRFEGSYREICVGLNAMIEAGVAPVRESSDVLKRIAAGDIAAEVRGDYRGEHRVIQESLNETVRVLREVLGSVGRLANAARNGELSTRASTNALQGSYRELVEGINAMLDATVEPVRASADVLERMARGDLSTEVEGDFQGDHRLIAENLNRTLHVLRALLAETGRMTEGARAGQLDTRADTAKFEGGYRELCTGINTMLDATLQPVRENATVLRRVAAGDLTSEARGECHGEHKLVQESLNRTVAVLRALLEQTNELTVAARSGALSKRMDAERFEGGYRELCSGVNSMLDGMLEPVRESTAVLRSVAEGDLSREVRGDYQGEHQLIQDSLNRTISVLRSLLDETGRLTQAARGGNLMERARLDQFQGGYRELVESINTLLDAIVDPIQATARTLTTSARRMQEMSQRMSKATDRTSLEAGTVSQGATGLQNNVDTVARGATELDTSIKEISRNTAEAATVAEKAVQRAREANATVERLGASSKEIEGVAKLISGIAAQSGSAAFSSSTRTKPVPPGG